MEYKDIKVFKVIIFFTEYFNPTPYSEEECYYDINMALDIFNQYVEHYTAIGYKIVVRGVRHIELSRRFSENVFIDIVEE